MITHRRDCQAGRVKMIPAALPNVYERTTLCGGIGT
jgi:hypothetical protein